MLEGVLYTVVSKEENSATVRLLIALELMGKKLVGAKEIKFVAPVLPGDGSEIRFEWEFKDENTVSVSILSMDGTQYARMSLSV